jgi:hypothetical protein
MESLLICLVLLASCFIWRYLALLSHELGHVLAARIGGLSPYLMKIGNGPKLFEFTRKALCIQMHLVPCVGMVTAHLPDQKLSTTKSLNLPMLLFTAGGLLVDIPRFALIWLVYRRSNPYSGETMIFLTLLTFEFLTLVSSLIPMTGKAYGQKHPNDIKAIFTLLTQDYRQELVAVYTAYNEIIIEHWNSNDADVSRLLDDLRNLQTLSQIALMIHDANFAEAISAIEVLLLMASLSNIEQSFLLHMLTDIAIHYGQQSYLPQADRWTQQALSLTPEVKVVQLSRGIVLVELENYLEAKEILLSLIEPGNDERDIAMSSCYLAKADAKLGNFEKAQSWFNRAQELSNQFPAMSLPLTEIAQDLAIPF